MDDDDGNAPTEGDEEVHKHWAKYAYILNAVIVPCTILVIRQPTKKPWILLGLGLKLDVYLKYIDCKQTY